MPWTTIGPNPGPAAGLPPLAFTLPPGPAPLPLFGRARLPAAAPGPAAPACHPWTPHARWPVAGGAAWGGGGGGRAGKGGGGGGAAAALSLGEYARGRCGLLTLVQYRRIADTTGRFPWFRRRSSPFAVTDTYTSLPDGSQPCGHDATSPCMRYFRLLISVVPYSFHAFEDRKSVV